MWNDALLYCSSCHQINCICWNCAQHDHLRLRVIYNYYFVFSHYLSFPQIVWEMHSWCVCRFFKVWKIELTFHSHFIEKSFRDVKLKKQTQAKKNLEKEWNLKKFSFSFLLTNHLRETKTSGEFLQLILVCG